MKQQPRKKTIYRSMLTVLIFCIAIPMLSFSFIFYRQIRTSFFQQAAEAEQKSMQLKIQAFFDQIQLITYSSRGIYFNTNVMELMNGSRPVSTINEQQEAEDYIFNWLANVMAMVPDAQCIQLTSFRQDNSYVLLRNYNRQVSFSSEKPEQFPRAYTSYIIPGDNDTIGFTVCLPFYDPPSVKDCLGEIRVTIPRERLEQLCANLYRPESREALFIYLADGQLLYASASPDSDVIRLQQNQPRRNNQCYLISAGKRTYLQEHLEQKNVDLLIIRDITGLADTPEVNRYLLLLLALFACFLLLVILLISLSISRFTIPLKQLALYTHSVNTGNLNTDIRSFINYHAPDEIGTLIDDVETMMHTINNHIIRVYRTEAANKSLKLQMLQAQISPHFLYNTLQCIAAEALEYDNHTLYSAITSLGQMMHYSMDTDHVDVLFSEEAAYCRNYLFLQQMRFPVSPDIHWDISPETAAVILPKMVLQPLIENAVKHGEIFKMPGCCLNIKALRVDSNILIQVTDTGKGASEEQLQRLMKEIRQVRLSVLQPNWQEMMQADLPESDTESYHTSESRKREVQTLQNNIGLKNVYLRLLLQYHTDCQISFKNIRPHGFSVTLLIPAPQTTPKGEHAYENPTD